MASRSHAVSRPLQLDSGSMLHVVNMRTNQHRGWRTSQQAWAKGAPDPGGRRVGTGGHWGAKPSLAEMVRDISALTACYSATRRLLARSSGCRRYSYVINLPTIEPPSNEHRSFAEMTHMMQLMEGLRRSVSVVWVWVCYSTVQYSTAQDTTDDTTSFPTIPSLDAPRCGHSILLYA